MGKHIHSVHVDSEVTCLMLTDGTQVTIHGWIAVEPRAAYHADSMHALTLNPSSQPQES